MIWPGLSLLVVFLFVMLNCYLYTSILLVVNIPFGCENSILSL